MKVALPQVRVMLIGIILAVSGILGLSAAAIASDLAAHRMHVAVFELHGTQFAAPAARLVAPTVEGQVDRTCNGACCSNSAGCSLCATIVVGEAATILDYGERAGHLGRIAADSMLAGQDPETGQRPPQTAS